MSRLFHVQGSVPKLYENGRTYRMNFQEFVVAKTVADAIDFALSKHEDGEVHNVNSRTGNNELQFAEGWDE